MVDSDELDLRSIEQHVRRYRKRWRPVRQIGDVISTLFARRGYAQTQYREDLQQAWEAAAGQRLAPLGRPTELRRGVLQIAVENSAAVQELTFEKARLLSGIKKLLAAQQIQDLRFQIHAASR